jgi:hypothetical protein
MPQGKKTSAEIVRKVRDLLFRDETLTGKELKTEVEKDRALAKLNISLRTYQLIRKEELPKVQMVRASVPENRWSLGAMANADGVTPEAIPYIMEVQKWALEQKMAISEQPFPPFSVRQAVWASRLLHLFFRMFDPETRLTEFGLSWLWKWSRAYSINERLYELSGKKGAFDTSELDAALLRRDRIDTFGDTYVRFSGEPNPGGENKSISVVTSDQEILKRGLNEPPIEESARTISELPNFKKMIQEVTGND